MSDLVVAVRPITKIMPHPNADNLTLTVVGGWQCVTAVNEYQVGDLVIQVPPDAMVPWGVAAEWGVDKYLSGYEKRGTPGHQYEHAGRVKAIKLRGEPSLGFIIRNQGFAEDEDVKEHFGIFKYEEPEKPAGGGAGRQTRNSQFWQGYTDIENQRNYQTVFEDGEAVIATEKLHGQNSVVGLVRVIGEEDRTREFIISSHKHQRLIGEGGNFEAPIHLYRLEEMANAIYDANFDADAENFASILIYGEIIGTQDLMYHCKSGQLDYCCFDIAINGRYIPHDEMLEWCAKFDIPTVPEVYRGPYDEMKLWSLASGKTLMHGECIREGVVVKPIVERTHPKVGRVILKFISADYLTRKGGTEYH